LTDCNLQVDHRLVQVCTANTTRLNNLQLDYQACRSTTYMCLHLLISFGSACNTQHWPLAGRLRLDPHFSQPVESPCQSDRSFTLLIDHCVHLHFDIDRSCWWVASTSQSTTSGLAVWRAFRLIESVCSIINQHCALGSVRRAVDCASASSVSDRRKAQVKVQHWVECGWCKLYRDVYRVHTDDRWEENELNLTTVLNFYCEALEACGRHRLAKIVLVDMKMIVSEFGT